MSKEKMSININGGLGGNKIKSRQMGLYQNNNFLKSKGNINKVKGQSLELEKIFITCTSDK
jgi:hypothetical protein